MIKRLFELYSVLEIIHLYVWGASMVVNFSTIFLKSYRYYLGIAVIVILIFASQSRYFTRAVQSYAISSTEDRYGSRSLTHEQEHKIKKIAQQLGITQTVNVRKMNAHALQQLGYHNAFAYFPQALNTIPLGNQAFMYISEGFFEDLDLEEQDFLIGHELMHIKEKHMKYDPLIYFVLIILMTCVVLLLRKKYSFLRHWIATIGLWITLMWVINFGQLAYRRHIERMADIKSIESLGTYTGLLKLVERWAKEYKMPLHNNYYGIFSDHPSVSERQAYCLEFQQNHKGT